MLHGLLATSPTRKNIIASERMRKNTSVFVKRFGLEWRSEEKPLKWLAVNVVPLSPNLKVGENERG
jgi:hypothetical protein